MAQTTLPFPEVSSKLLAEEQDALRTVPIEEIPEWARERAEVYKRRIKEVEGEHRLRQIKELQEHIATFHTLQNTGALVSRLPNEVLGAIFAASACGLHEDELPHRSIAVVCRRWKDVLLATPMFWAESISATSSACSPSWGSKRLSQLIFAIQHSGALPLSLSLDIGEKDLDPRGKDHRFLSALAGHPGRIAQLELRDVRSIASLKKLLYLPCMRGLHSVSIIFGEYFTKLALDGSALPSLRFLTLMHTIATPQSVVSSLETLRLVDVNLDLGEFHTVLERCPRLQVLTLDLVGIDGNATGNRSPKIALQKLSINCPYRATELLLLYFFTPICAQLITFVHIFVHVDYYPPPNLSPWDPPPGENAFPPCVFDRICLREPHGPCDFVIGGYTGMIERLQILAFGRSTRLSRSPDDWLPIPFRVPTISVLVLDRQSPHAENHRFRCEGFIEMLPHVRRIELPYRAVEALSFSASFLRFHAEIAGDLSIAWVLGVQPGEEGLSRAEEDLEGLLSLLQQHMDGGKPRLGRLELYAVRVWSGFKREPYAGRLDEHADAALCRKVVGPFLSRLEEVVDVVVL